MGPKKKPHKKELSASQLLSELTTEAEGDGSSQLILTQASLEKALEKVINEHFNPTVKSLQDSLAEVTEVATNALKMVEIQKAKIAELQTECDALKQTATRVTAIEERVEERTNHQLRKT